MTDASVTDHANDDSAAPIWPLDQPEVRVRIGVLVAAFVLLHAETIFRIGWIAWTDGDWSHAFLIPLISLYFIHQRRDRLAGVRYHTYWPGLAICVVATAAYLYGVAQGIDVLKGYAMIANLFGLVLLLAGPAAMRVCALPVIYLVFAVKLPDALWADIAWYLQLAAAESSVVTLMLLGVDANVTVTTIDLWHDGQPLGALNVAEACSGMRMLMTFLALSVAVAYLSDRSWWARLTLCLAAVPIAILANIGRVTVLGLLYMIDPQWAQGDFHLFMGMVMLLPAIAMFAGVWWVVEHLDQKNDAETHTRAEAPRQ